MHSLHTRYMLGFIRSLHGGVRFSYVPYVVHPFISRYSPVTTCRCTCSSSVYHTVSSVVHQFFSVHYPFIIRYVLKNFAKFGTVYERVRTYEVNFTRYSSVSAYSLMCDRGITRCVRFPHVVSVCYLVLIRRSLVAVRSVRSSVTDD